jgi:hypothetical protein
MPKLNHTQEFVLRVVEERGPTSSGELMVRWAKEHGTKGNVVTWPKQIVCRAIVELKRRGLLTWRQEGSAA